jgi:hypothetical protein
MRLARAANMARACVCAADQIGLKPDRSSAGSRRELGFTGDRESLIEKRKASRGSRDTADREDEEE